MLDASKFGDANKSCKFGQERFCALIGKTLIMHTNVSIYWIFIAWYLHSLVHSLVNSRSHALFILGTESTQTLIWS